MAMKKSLTRKMNNKIQYSNYNDNLESNDIKAKFRKCVRRQLVLNKG
jgi:hypothetical protein